MNLLLFYCRHLSLYQQQKAVKYMQSEKMKMILTLFILQKFGTVKKTTTTH